MVSLKKNAEFQRVYHTGASRGNRVLVMYIAPNDLPVSRLGVSVSKKVGNSVVRHRIKRLVKECFRLNEAAISPGYDIVVIARAGAKGIGYQEMSEAFFKNVRAHGIGTVKVTE